MTFEIPDRIIDYVESKCGCNLQINYNVTDGVNGYGQIVHYSVHISILTRTCNRCGYDPLWNPRGWESKCFHHSYNHERYDDVFVWSGACGKTLERCFDDWVNMQSMNTDEPMRMGVFK